MGIHAAAAEAAGDSVAIVAGRGSERGVPVIKIPELDSQHPAVLRDRAALTERQGVVHQPRQHLVVRAPHAASLPPDGALQTSRQLVCRRCATDERKPEAVSTRGPDRLAQLVDADMLRRCAQIATGEKYAAK